MWTLKTPPRGLNRRELHSWMIKEATRGMPNELDFKQDTELRRRLKLLKKEYLLPDCEGCRYEFEADELIYDKRSNKILRYTCPQCGVKAGSWPKDGATIKK